MSNAIDRLRINVKGGGPFYFRELSPTPSNTYLAIGYNESTKLDDAHSIVADMDEEGIIPDSQSGGQIVKINLNLMQSSEDEINLIRNSGGKYYEGYYACTLKNGNIQEISIPLFVFSPKLELDFKAATGRKVAVEITCLAPKAAYTRGVTDFNVTKNVPYILVDNATAQFNLSNTEASALATAIL